MKTILLSLIAALSLQASATSPVRPPETALLQVYVGGGMRVPGGLAGRSLTVHADGLVDVVTYRHGEDFNNMNEPRSREYKEIGQVSPQDIILIQEAVATLNGGDFQKSNEPQCKDAPSYTYGVVKERFFSAVYMVQDCRHLQLRNKSQRAAALNIKNFLDGYLKLAR